MQKSFLVIIYNLEIKNKSQSIHGNVNGLALAIHRNFSNKWRWFGDFFS